MSEATTQAMLLDMREELRKLNRKIEKLGEAATKPRLISSQEICQLEGISKSTLRNMVRDGRMPKPVKRGWYNRKEYESWDA